MRAVHLRNIVPSVTEGARRRCRLALIDAKTPDQEGSVLVSERGQFLLSLDTPLQNVSTARVDSGGFGWTAVNETERRNRL